MLTYNELDAQIKAILAKQLGLEAANIKSESKLVEDLGMDSFGSIETAFALEDTFTIKIPDKALYEAKIVKDIVDFIAKEKGITI